MEFVVIGKIVTTHALKGEVKITVDDENATRFKKGRTIYIGEAKTPVEVERSRDNGLVSIVRFKGYETIESIEAFVKSFVYADMSSLPKLEEGRYYVKDLVGLDVFSTEGEPIGIVDDVLHYAANDVYVLRRPSGKLAYVPAIKSVVKEIALVENKMVIELMEGMLDEN